MEYNLADLWECVADTVPDHEALVCAGRTLTFAQEDARATRLANALAEQGIGPGDHIACYLYNSIEYLEVMLAAFKLRAVPINVNYRYVEDELQYLLDDADVKAVVFHREFAAKLAAISSSLPELHTYLAVDDATDAPAPALEILDYETLVGAASPERSFGPRSPDDLYILYTGGTTGMPKGVMWRHEDVFFGALGGGNLGEEPITRPEEIVDSFDVHRRVLPAAPFMHATAHWMAFGTLYSGGTVVISPDRHLDPVRLWELIARERVS